jgi:hypothetical protein
MHQIMFPVSLFHSVCHSTTLIFFAFGLMPFLLANELAPLPTVLAILCGPWAVDDAPVACHASTGNYSIIYSTS